MERTIDVLAQQQALGDGTPPPCDDEGNPTS